MAVVISLGLLSSGLYVLLTADWGENPQMVAAATGWMSFVIGYWMK
jgi:hypothetical protein